MSEALATGDVYMLLGDRHGLEHMPNEYYMLLERRSDGSWWMLNLDTGGREWDTDVSLRTPQFYKKVA